MRLVNNLVKIGEITHDRAPWLFEGIPGDGRHRTAPAPEEVFRFLADLQNWPRSQSDMKSATLAEGQPGQVGAVCRYLSKARA